MRWSQAPIPTLREDPAAADATSHRLLLRGGFIRPIGAGIYAVLPLGQRVLARVAGILRDELARIGALEFHLPALHPAELWKESGRWDEIGAELFRLRDRRQAELCLGMTHEEIFTSLARDILRSYRQLPQIWYQIQSKFRDEPRPKGGVLRSRQFTMKDSYSFDIDAAGLDRSFELHAQAYARIFSRCGIDAIPVEAASGAMGGSASIEFMCASPAGEDWVVRCPSCGLAVNLEKARSALPVREDPDDPVLPESFPTPGVRTIEDLARFEGGAGAADQIKTLVYVASSHLVLVLLRGDDTLNEVKLAEAAGTQDLRPAAPEEIRAALGARPGSLGAVGVREHPIWADARLRGRRSMTTGANRDDVHLRHVDVARDIANARFFDLREIRAGEPCERCAGPLEIQKAIEVGHIFKLGTRYSERMGATVLGPDGKRSPLSMGSYGIGLERLMATAVEVHHDAAGIRWPREIAPYDVVIVPLRMNQAPQRQAAERLERELGDANLDVLCDDRDERPGVKFKDADLIGIPYRIVLGPRSLQHGRVELFERASGKTVEIPLEAVAKRLTA